MAWFRKDKSGVEAQQKRNIPEGLWTKCQSCGEIAYSKKLEELLWICPNCDFHFRISSRKYIDLLLDGGRLEEYDADLASGDPLKKISGPYQSGSEKIRFYRGCAGRHR